MTDRHLELDADTIADLGIVESVPETKDLLSFIDRTWLPESRLYLKRLLVAPLATPQEIGQRQTDLQLISRLRGSIRADSLENAVDRTELYLASRRPPFPHGRVARLIVRFTSPQRFRDVFAGLTAAKRVMSFARSLVRLLEQGGLGTGELRELCARITELLDRPPLSDLEHAEAPFAVSGLDEMVRISERQLMRTLIDLLRTFDALQCLARLDGLPGFSYPAVVESETPFIDVQGLFHPLLAAPVANDLKIGEESRLVFLTGPNMAGKSTHLKSCALLVVLAQLGTAVPARTARLSVFDRVFASLTVRDSLQSGESYYLAEVRRIARLVGHLLRGERVFGVLDEVFKGTNVHDASDGTELVVSSLGQCERAVTIVASHIAELADKLATAPGIRMFYFDSVLEDGMLTFDYRLHPGVSHRRLGMRILSAEGVTDALRSLQARTQT